MLRGWIITAALLTACGPSTPDALDASRADADRVDGGGADATPADADATPADADAVDADADAPIQMHGPRVRRLTSNLDATAHVWRWAPVEGADGYVVVLSDAPHTPTSIAATYEVDEPMLRDPDARAGALRCAAVWPRYGRFDGPPSGERCVRPVVPRVPRAAHLTVAPADLETLYTRDIRSDELLDATLDVRPVPGEVATRGLRFRGASSRSYPKKSLHVRLDERPTFNFGSDDRRGGNRLLLNSMWTDPSGLREHLCFAMYGALGRPAPATFPMDVYMNDVFEGHYVAVERIDAEALAGWGLRSSRFTLVRDESKSNRDVPGVTRRSFFGIDIDAIRDTDEARIALLQQVFDYRGEVEDHDWEGLLDLIRWASRARAGEPFAAELEQRFDVDALLDVLAVHALTHDMDSLDTDFWLYRDESAATPRWLLIPWDKNLTFGTNWVRDGANDFIRYDQAMVASLGNRIVDYTLATPSLRDRLYARLDALMDEMLSPDWLDAAIAARLPELLGGFAREGDGSYAQHPAQHHGDLGMLPYHLETLRDVTERRYAWIRARTQPVEGEPWSATATVPAGSTDAVLLRDAAGTTLARVVPMDAAEAPRTLTLQVEIDEDLDGVQRRYLLTSSGPLRVELTLYYDDWPGRRWLEGDHATGPQWNLDLVHEAEGGVWLRHGRSVVNPYANFVRSVVLLDGAQTYALTYGP